MFSNENFPLLLKGRNSANINEVFLYQKNLRNKNPLLWRLLEKTMFNTGLPDQDLKEILILL